MGADETANLVRQRIERRKKYQAERPEKEPARQQISGRREVGPEHTPQNRFEIEIHNEPAIRGNAPF